MPKNQKRVKAGRLAKNRGRNNEYILAEYGNKLGLDIQVKRRPLSGSLRDEKLDVVVRIAGNEVERFEAKYHKNGDGFKSLYDLLYNNIDHIDCWYVKDKKYVIMDYCEYLEAKYGDSSKNFVSAVFPSNAKYKTITDWMDKAIEQGGTGVVCRMFRCRKAMLIISQEVFHALEAV